jgi:hypothetical protein
MAKDQKPVADLSAATKQTMEQMSGAVDTYFDYLRKTISSAPSGGTEFGEKVKDYAEKNISATHEFIKQLSQAKDFQDVLRIQTEFMQSQLNAFGEQTKTLGEAFTKVAAGAGKTPSS